MFKKLAAATVFAALGLAATDANANHPWGTYHWAVTPIPADGSPAVLGVGNNLTTTDWAGKLSSTIGAWNNPQAANQVGAQPTSTEKRIVPYQITGTAGTNCGAVRGTTQVCNKKYGNNGWLGLAQIWLSGSHILQGTAKMNDTYFVLSSYNNASEKLHVMCQEMAHTFGLGHQSTDGSTLGTCMDYYSNRTASDTKSTVPNLHDFGQLVAIYNHDDKSTTLSSTAVAALKSVPSDLTRSSEWGRLVAQSPEGRTSVYERQFAGGIRIATHVTWTVEAASKCASCDHRFEVRE